MPTKMIFQASKVGCPIRRSMDQSSFAAPHGFSQRITSFIACACQGIHQMPFFHLIVLIANAHRLCWIWQTYLLACARRGAKSGHPGNFRMPQQPKSGDLAVARPAMRDYLLQSRFLTMPSTCSIWSSQKSRRATSRPYLKTSFSRSVR